MLLAGLLLEGGREIVIYRQCGSHTNMMLIQAPGVKADTGPLRDKSALPMSLCRQRVISARMGRGNSL